MFQHIIIGQYVPGKTFIHQMDARAKILAIFILVLVIFLANNWIAYGSLVLFSSLLILLSRVPLRFVYKGMKPIFILVLITFILHLLINKEGNVLYTIGPVSIYESGFRQGAFIAIRIIVIVMITSLLTLTTTPIDLTDGLERILSPFKRVGLPAHELALMMSIALRFIPTLIHETEKIVKAQMARGADFSSGSVKSRLKAVIPLLIPLFISSFKRAEDLALAMESRGYRGGEGRTKYRLLHWRWSDSLLLGSTLLVGVGLFLLRT